MHGFGSSELASEVPSEDVPFFGLLTFVMTSTRPPQAGPSNTPAHPFANSKNLLVVIPDDGIDVEEESRLYDELCDLEVGSSFGD